MNRRTCSYKKCLALLSLLVLALSFNLAYAAAYLNPSRITSAGSAYQQSAHYTLNSTSGQSAPVGVSSSASYIHSIGFWHANTALSVTAVAGVHGRLNAASPSTLMVNIGDTASFTLDADYGYYVTSVTGCGLNYANTLETVTHYTATTAPVTEECSISASFAPILRRLNLANQNSQGGTVTSDTGGIDCGAVCNSTPVLGTVVTLTAAPQTGFTFAGWTGACSGLTLTCGLTIDADTSVGANFKANQTLVFGSAPAVVVGAIGLLAANGGGSGNPIVFNSQTPAICTVNGNSVSGIAVGTCTVTADQAGNDNFNAAMQANQTFVVGKGSQSLTFGPAPNLAVGNCAALSATGGASGNPVVFSAPPSASPVCVTTDTNGSTVCALKTGSCVIQANQSGNANYTDAAQATLTFDTGWALSVANANPSGGSVVSDVGGIVCGTNCKQSYANGTLVTLTPLANAGSFFTGWSGVCHGKGATCQVTLDKSKTVTASFGAIKKDTLVIDFNPYGLWLRHNDGNWDKLHDLPPSQLVPADVDGNGVTDLVIDFKPYGTWAWMNRKDWLSVHDSSPSLITAIDFEGYGHAELVADSGSGMEKWVYNQGWSTFFGLSPKSITAAYLDEDNWKDLFLDFAPYGLWQRLIDPNNGKERWLQTDANRSPTLSAVGDLDGNGHEDVVFSLGADGLWGFMNNSSWLKLHPLPALALVAADLNGNGKTDLAVDFGQPYGLWKWMDDGSWANLHGLSPSAMTAANVDGDTQQDLVIDFAPYGVWAYKNNSAWEKLIDGPKSSRIVALPEN